jgi:hypothetical protein
MLRSHSDETLLTVLVLVLLLLNILAGCASGPNQSRGMATDHDVAGFWLGLWQGFSAPFVFVASLFQSSLSIYEVHNNGAWYNFRYLFGLAYLWTVLQKRRRVLRPGWPVSFSCSKA